MPTITVAHVSQLHLTYGPVEREKLPEIGGAFKDTIDGVLLEGTVVDLRRPGEHNSSGDYHIVIKGPMPRSLRVNVP